MKKTILHFAYKLGRGGAETMLVRDLRALTEYRNIVVIMGHDDHFGAELQCDAFIRMGLENMAQFPLAIGKLRQIIRKYKPDLVHTHLFWPTFFARLAVPKRIPLVTTIHAFIASSLEYKRRHIRMLDKYSFRFRPSAIIAVAKGAMKEYADFLGAMPKQHFVLYTFVDMKQFVSIPPMKDEISRPVKMVSVGALREQKNFPYLLDSMKHVPSGVALHIYGTGPLRLSLTEQVNRHNLPVTLHGEVSRVQDVLPDYQVFTMASTYEGFSLAVLEAMAMRIPMLLSDIPSFREQCDGTATYFDLHDEKDFARKLETLMSDPGRMKQLAEAAFVRVSTQYTFDHHIKGLRDIYSILISGSKLHET